MYVSKKPNLFREGYAFAAEQFEGMLRSRRDGVRYCLYADHDGTVRWVALSVVNRGRVKPIPDEHLVGTYDRHARVETIEGDLIERMRELSNQRRAA